MNCLDLFMLRSSEPGSLEMKDQIQRNLKVHTFLGKAKTYAGKHLTIGLKLESKVTVDPFGLNQLFAGEQKGGFSIAFAEGLQQLQGANKFPGEYRFVREMVIDVNISSLTEYRGMVHHLTVEQLCKGLQLAFFDG